MNIEDVCFKFINGKLKKVYRVDDRKVGSITDDMYNAKLRDIRDWINTVI